VREERILVRQNYEKNMEKSMKKKYHKTKQKLKNKEQTEKILFSRAQNAYILSGGKSITKIARIARYSLVILINDININ